MALPSFPLKIYDNASIDIKVQANIIAAYDMGFHKQRLIQRQPDKKQSDLQPFLKSHLYAAS
jgi:hypothetical protein